MKNIWIWNHYATNMFKDHAGRHYWFSENLLKKGYSPTIFCASTIHNSNEVIDTKGQKYILDNANGIPFVFLKTPIYAGNGKQRIRNMAMFFKNLFPVSEEYAKKYGKPDLILASSVHPLTLVAGIKIAKKFGVPCICEVRDLWPESIVAYGSLKRNNIFAKLLYQGEKWIYKRADSIIMTWEGGAEYILDQKWDKQINLDKVNYISNGVVIEEFDKNCMNNKLSDPDLDDLNYKNVVYTGSIRKVNDIGLILNAAKIIQLKGIKDIRFLIYGSGDQKEQLEKRCTDEGINNVIFKGRVKKNQVPSILKRSHVNLLHNLSTSLNKYGQSQNKLFEYLAAGKCIVQTYPTGYSICERYDCGVVAPKQNPVEIAKAIISSCEDDEVNKSMGKNARSAAYQFDFNILTDKLIHLIESFNEGEEQEIGIVQ
ncbi:glycosyltransferase family 4 protein [Shouchella clausii]|uniref:glycosyltransferase family 4 protein n=1 Tax=Shouchella clausii TaxID=79880 RepID=UPI000BA59409|nr:glycosyltransferase family 4 protein [Shouchella clausii]PAE96544.1 glycosyltransferase WbuB [Shouchella clausii]